MTIVFNEKTIELKKTSKSERYEGEEKQENSF